MNNDELDKQLLNYFSDTKLNSGKLDDILAESARLTSAYEEQLAVDESSSDQSFPDNPGWWVSLQDSRLLRGLLPFGVIAAPAMVAAYFVVTLMLGSENLNRNDIEPGSLPLADGGSVALARLVLQEAAMNHQSKLQLDIDTGDMETLQSGMQRLDFDLSIPDALAAGYELLGGRYCTLGGQLAAHLRLENRYTDLPPTVVKGMSGTSDPESLRARSVFVTRSSANLEHIVDSSKEFPGDVQVTSWKSGDLFYVLAEGLEVPSRIQ